MSPCLFAVIKPLAPPSVYDSTSKVSLSFSGVLMIKHRLNYVKGKLGKYLNFSFTLKRRLKLCCKIVSLFWLWLNILCQTWQEN